MPPSQHAILHTVPRSSNKAAFRPGLPLHICRGSNLGDLASLMLWGGEPRDSNGRTDRDHQDDRKALLSDTRSFPSAVKDTKKGWSLSSFKATNPLFFRQFPRLPCNTRFECYLLPLIVKRLRLQCGREDSNLHSFWEHGPQPCASANSATPAAMSLNSTRPRLKRLKVSGIRGCRNPE